MKKRVLSDPKNLIFGHSRVIKGLSESDLVRLANNSNAKMMAVILATVQDKKKREKCLEIAKSKGIQSVFNK